MRAAVTQNLQRRENEINWLNSLALTPGAIFFVLLPWHPCPLSFVLKPSGILVLATLAALSGRRLSKGLALGLAFGAGGDILFDVNLFQPGLASFLVLRRIYNCLFILTFREARHGQVERVLGRSWPPQF